MSGTIRKTNNGRWIARIFIGYNDKGKRRYWSQTFDRRKDAEAALVAKAKERNDYSRVIEPTKVTVEKYLKDWLEASVRPRVAPKTYESYKYAIEKHLSPQIGSYALKRLTPELIQGVYQHLEEQGLSPATIRRTHAVLRNALQQAVRWRRLPFNPAEAGFVDLPKQRKKEMKTLSQEDAKAFLDAIEGNRWQSYFELLLVTGMRPSEALGLKWTDIDWKSRTVTISRSLSRPKNGKEWLLTEPKTKGSRRTIPLPPEMIESLKQHQKRQAEENMQLRIREGAKKEQTEENGENYTPREYAQHGLVFGNQVGEPADLQNISNRHFKPIIRALGLDGLRLYDLRHTCATLLLQSGTNPKIVAEMLGHSGITLTLDTYSHVDLGMKELASANIRKLIY